MDKMQHLSAMDSAFLHLETAEMPMHVGSLHRYQLPEGYQGNWHDDVKQHLARRLHLAPVFTRKLALMPFDLANPVWIEDDDLDLDYHIRHTVLPKPGTQEQLEALAARLHSSLLDRSRPLWEFYVIEGLADGTMGFYSKVHHAAIDGQAGVALGNAMLDLTPVPRAVKPPRAHRTHRYQLGVAELLGAALSNTLRQARMIGKLIVPLGKALLDSARKSVAERRLGLGALRSLLTMPPPTPFNVSITNQRVFAALIAAAGRSQAPGQGAWRVDQRPGAVAVLERAARVPEGITRTARGLAGGRRAGVAACRGRHAHEQPGDDEPGGPGHAGGRPAGTAAQDPRRHRVDEEHHGRLRRADPDRLPVAGRALAAQRAGLAVRPLRPGRPHPRVQRRHLQRARLAGAAVPGRREDARLLPGVDRHPRRRAEHHGAELHGPALLRPDRLPPRGAGRARHRAADATRLRRLRATAAARGRRTGGGRDRGAARRRPPGRVWPLRPRRR